MLLKVDKLFFKGLVVIVLLLSSLFMLVILEYDLRLLKIL